MISLTALRKDERCFMQSDCTKLLILVGKKFFVSHRFLSDATEILFFSPWKEGAESPLRVSWFNHKQISSKVNTSFCRDKLGCLPEVGFGFCLPTTALRNKRGVLGIIRLFDVEIYY